MLYWWSKIFIHLIIEQASEVQTKKRVISWDAKNSSDCPSHIFSISQCKQQSRENNLKSYHTCIIFNSLHCVYASAVLSLYSGLIWPTINDHESNAYTSASQDLCRQRDGSILCGELVSDKIIHLEKKKYGKRHQAKKADETQSPSW